MDWRDDVDVRSADGQRESPYSKQTHEEDDSARSEYNSHPVVKTANEFSAAMNEMVGKSLVDRRGVEPLTSAVQRRRSPN